MIRINKPLARKMFISGHTITVVPCKCGWNNEVARMHLSMLDTNCRFDTKVREFEYYNCNKDTGYYAHYYVTEEVMEQYNMCNIMCGG